MTLPTTMIAITMSEPGGPEVLKSTITNLPARNENEVLIKVTSAGVNGPDLVQRRAVVPRHQEEVCEEEVCEQEVVREVQATYRR